MSTCPATLTVKITDAAGRTSVPYALIVCREDHPADTPTHAGNHPGNGSLVMWTAGDLVAVVDETATPAPVKRGPGRPRKIPEQRTEQP